MKEVYHYTSLETLKLILKNCNLRFKSLSGVDDPNEEKTSDFGAFGHMTYVSCWTSLKDSIPQWSMYGDEFKGVMITLRFEDVKDVFRTLKVPMGKDLVDVLPIFLPLLEVIPTRGYLPIFQEIEYTNDVEKITPKVLSVEETNLSINFGVMGKYKTEDWDFQKESRFIFSCIPMSFSKMLDFMEENKGEFGPAMVNKLANMERDLQHLDIMLNPNIFENLTITFGPNCSVSEKKEIKDFANNLGFKLSFEDSNVKIRR